MRKSKFQEVKIKILELEVVSEIISVDDIQWELFAWESKFS